MHYGKIDEFRNINLKLLGIFSSESGFKPIVEGQGGSIPTLAFSVNDGAERPPVTADLYHQDFLQRRQDLLDDLVVNQLAQVRPNATLLDKESTNLSFHQDYQSGGDRSSQFPVNVPAPVVPYAPSSSTASAVYPNPSTITQRTISTSPNSLRRNNKIVNKINSADFDEFDELPETDDDYVYEEEYDEGYKETDRIDVQTPLVIDPYALVYSQQSAPYGKEHPSFVSYLIIDLKFIYGIYYLATFTNITLGSRIFSHDGWNFRRQTLE